MGVLEFSQKWTNEFYVVIKTNLFLQFLGEFDDTKSPFEIIRPLVNVSIPIIEQLENLRNQKDVLKLTDL